MIDKLCLRASFSDPDRFHIDRLGLPLTGDIEPTTNEVFNLRHHWESIPSSFSTMAFRTFDYADTRLNPEPFIEIKASPAKLLQGHNVYGSDDLGECAMVLIQLLVDTYPRIADRLDWSSWHLVETDITYASWAKSAREASQFIDALLNVSNGQTRSRAGFAGTAYFGSKGSRLKKIKVYDKLKEILQYLSDHQKSNSNPSQYYPQELLDWCVGMIRWEATLKSRWFERRGIPTNLLELKKIFNAQAYWQEATADLFKALEGENMKFSNDHEVLEQLKARFMTLNMKTGKPNFTKANSAYRTYLAIKDKGYSHTRELMPRETFRLHIDMLCQCGFSKAQIQNMTSNHGAQIIPLVRYAVVEFRNQYPLFSQAA